MIRAALLLLPALMLVACRDDSGSPESKPGKTGQSQTEREPKVGTAPVTGSPVFRRDTDAITRDIEALEKQGRPSDPAELAKFESEVGMKIRHIDINLQALKSSIAAESKAILEASHGALLKKRQVIDKEIDGKWREITEIRELLDSASKGSDAIPPGFTEDEMKDRLADLEEQVRTLRGSRTDLNTELQGVIDRLASDQTIAEQGETTLTQERTVLLKLKTRAEKLLEKN